MQLALQEGYDAVFLLNQDAWIGSDTLATLAEQSVKHPEFGILSPVHLNGSGEELDKGFASYAQLASINNLPHGHEPISCLFINAAFGLFQSALYSGLEDFLLSSTTTEKIKIM